MKNPPTAEQLREILHYCPDTGVFTRKGRTAQRHHAGDRADFLWKDSKRRGYRRVSINSDRFLAHRLAWLYVYGDFPATGMDVDHINGNKGDNRIANLRIVTREVNLQNLRHAKTHNKCGVLGVQEHLTGVWRARIQVHGVIKHLGLFSSPDNAHKAYLHAKRELHEGCSI